MFKIFLFPASVMAALGFLFTPVLVRADAPPPPPFTVYVDYEGAKVADEVFYAAVLTCREEDPEIDEEVFQAPPQTSVEERAYASLDVFLGEPAEGCFWQPLFLPFTDYCADGACHFDWLLRGFRVIVYLPSLDKTFVSNVLYHDYLGYYGRETPRFYSLQLTEDNQAVLSETLEQEGRGESGGTTEETVADRFTAATSILGWAMLVSLALTLFLELVAALIFAFIKKTSKKILWGVAIGNLVSVPLLWLTVTISYNFLWPAELVVVLFEMWLLRLFSRKKLGWGWCLLFSFLMNFISFVVGPIIYY